MATGTRTGNRPGPAKQTARPPVPPVKETAPAPEMTPEQRETVAPSAETARQHRTEAVIDYSTLTVVDAEPVVTTRKSALDGTPFPAWVKASWDAKITADDGTVTHQAKSITVPENAADQCAYLLRKAAEQAGHGIKVKLFPPADGKVRIDYQAKDKRAYTENPEAAAKRAATKKERSELQAALTALNLPTKGNTKELRERLAAARKS